MSIDLVLRKLFTVWSMSPFEKITSINWIFFIWTEKLYCKSYICMNVACFSFSIFNHNLMCWLFNLTFYLTLTVLCSGGERFLTSWKVRQFYIETSFWIGYKYYTQAKWLTNIVMEYEKLHNSKGVSWLQITVNILIDCIMRT